jgi:hypothetical protein
MVVGTLLIETPLLAVGRCSQRLFSWSTAWDTRSEVRSLPIVCFALAVAACGEQPEPPSRQVSYEQRLEHLTSNPYDFTCADQQVARFGKHVHFALADDAQFPDINRLRAAQSLFFAMTELCKGKPPSFKPAEQAVAGVRSGRYRATLGSGSE